MNKQINAIFTDELPEEVRLASERDKEPMQDVIIDAVRIKGGFQHHIVALFSNNEGCKVITYFPDEIHFNADEVIGLTRSQASELFRRKDTAYLRS